MTVRRRNGLFVGLMSWALTLSAPAAAQVASEPPVSAPQEAGVDTMLTEMALPDSASMAAWIDGWMKARLDADHVAGATVAIVREGRLWFARGYGYADLETKKPVDAETSLFRIGSISKLFVWTSVMQLVEQGLVDLDEDINTYLDTVEVPAAFDRPVTLADLMTHSAGFEDHVIGLFGKDSTDLRPAEELLSEEMPARVRPPGEVTSYSNHGTALAMQVVEDVSGEPWVTYIERHILGPLGMRHTTFRQPLPPGLADDASLGYEPGGREAQPFELVPLGAVGAAAATATDMARFMVAHLQLGELEGARILEEETSTEMQSELFRNAPGVDPFLHGFADLSRHGRYVIGHGGDTFWFHSQLSLLPEQNLGIFVSMNTPGSPPQAFVDAFLDRYFGEEELGTLSPSADFASRVSRYVGTFRSNRFSHSDFTKVSALLGGLRVRSAGDSALAIKLGDDREWVETAPLTFRSVDSDRVLAFRENEDGVTTHLFLGDVPYVSWERVPRLENPTLHLVLGVFALLVFLFTVISQPVITWFRVRHKFVHEDPVPGIGRLLGWLAAALFLLYALLMLPLTALHMNDIAMGDLGVLPRLSLLPLAAVVLTGLTLVFVLITWVSGKGSRSAQIAFTVLGVALVLFTWQLNVWNLLGWHG